MFGCDPGAVRLPSGARLCQAAEASAGRARKMKAADGVMGGGSRAGFLFSLLRGPGTRGGGERGSAVRIYFPNAVKVFPG